MTDVDLIVLGGGSGGLAAAQRAATLGARVALLEPHALGGTCVHAGCVPKKAMWLAAQLATKGRLAPAIGFEHGVGTLHWPTFVAHRQRYIAAIEGGYAEKLANAGIAVIAQRGRFVEARASGSTTIEVSDGAHWRAPHVLIATGARAQRPDVTGAALGVVSDDVFGWSALPKRIAVVGGGYVAVEFAGLLRALGVEVAMRVRGARLLDGFDAELAEALAAQYRALGIDLRFETMVDGLTRDGHRVRCGDEVFDAVLWATGRTPNSDNLGLEALGMARDPRGRIVVDAQQRTNLPGVYAVGDVTAQPALTPVAVAAGRHLAERLFGSSTRAAPDLSAVPTVVFSQPPLASVGLSEAEARAAHGEGVSVRRSRFRPMLTALAGGESRSLFKVVCVGAEQRVVGLHLLGEGADEILQGFALAMARGLTADDLAQAIAIHPTSAEEVLFAK
jgi:glutathione reductase (NADPH)